MLDHFKAAHSPLIGDNLQRQSRHGYCLFQFVFKTLF